MRERAEDPSAPPRGVSRQASGSRTHHQLEHFIRIAKSLRTTC
jgi:hypothetical protein